MPRKQRPRYFGVAYEVGCILCLPTALRPYDIGYFIIAKTLLFASNGRAYSGTILSSRCVARQARRNAIDSVLPNRLRIPRIQASDAALLCAVSASRSIGGSSFPRRSARRIIPRQAFALK